MFSEPLLAGLPQMVKFTLLTGHYTVKKGDALQLSNTDTMPILPSSSCTAHISNPAAGQCMLLKFNSVHSITHLVRTSAVGVDALIAIS